MRGTSLIGSGPVRSGLRIERRPAPRGRPRGDCSVQPLRKWTGKRGSVTAVYGGRLSRTRPLKAGVGIAFYRRSTRQYTNPSCTLSYAARKRGSSPAHRWYALTAGHCIGEGWRVTQGADPADVRSALIDGRPVPGDIGIIDKVVEDGGVDSARIRIKESIKPTRVIKSSSKSYRIVGVRDSRRQALNSVGDPICVSGVGLDPGANAPPFSCGEITRANTGARFDRDGDGDLDGPFLKPLGCAATDTGITSERGFSGGPLFERFRRGGTGPRVTRALGTLVGGGGDSCGEGRDGTYFSHIHFVEERMDIDTAVSK